LHQGGVTNRRGIRVDAFQLQPIPRRRQISAAALSIFFRAASRESSWVSRKSISRVAWQGTL